MFQVTKLLNIQQEMIRLERPFLSVCETKQRELNIFTGFTRRKWTGTQKKSPQY